MILRTLLKLAKEEIVPDGGRRGWQGRFVRWLGWQLLYIVIAVALIWLVSWLLPRNRVGGIIGLLMLVGVPFLILWGIMLVGLGSVGREMYRHLTRGWKPANLRHAQAQQQPPGPDRDRHRQPAQGGGTSGDPRT